MKFTHLVSADGNNQNAHQDSDISVEMPQIINHNFKDDSNLMALDQQ
jgi:hypothetical protein